MAYDSALRVTTLFGGYNSGVALGDTWIWNGNVWKPTFATVAPHAPEAMTPVANPD